MPGAPPFGEESCSVFKLGGSGRGDSPNNSPKPCWPVVFRRPIRRIGSDQGAAMARVHLPHHWAHRRVEVKGKTIFHRQCITCRRDFVWDSNGAGWRAVHVGLLDFNFLDEKSSQGWLSEDCPGRELPEEINDRRVVATPQASGLICHARSLSWGPADGTSIDLTLERGVSLLQDASIAVKAAAPGENPRRSDPHGIASKRQRQVGGNVDFGKSRDTR